MDVAEEQSELDGEGCPKVVGDGYRTVCDGLANDMRLAISRHL